MEKPKFRIVEKRGVFRIEKEIVVRGTHDRNTTITYPYSLPILRNILQRDTTKTEIYYPCGWEVVGQHVNQFDSSIVDFEWRLPLNGIAQAGWRGFKPYEYQKYETALAMLYKWEGLAVNLIEPEWRTV